MPKIFPVVVKRTTVVVESGAANAVWSESVDLADPTLNETVFTNEDPEFSDSIQDTVQVWPEPAQMVAAFTPTGESDWSETEDMSEGLLLDHTVLGPEETDLSDVIEGVVAPAADAAQFSEPALSDTTALADEVDSSDQAHLELSYPSQGDGYLDQNAPDANFGSLTTMLAKGKATVGSNEQRAYAQFDLTKFANWQGDQTGLRLSFRASTSNGLTATNLSVEFRSGGTQPFNEGTFTWNGKSATLSTYGTNRGTNTVSIATGAAANYATSISIANTTAAISDGWLLVIFTTPNGVSPDTVTISTEESANAEHIALNLKR